MIGTAPNVQRPLSPPPSCRALGTSISRRPTSLQLLLLCLSERVGRVEFAPRHHTSIIHHTGRRFALQDAHHFELASPSFAIAVQSTRPHFQLFLPPTTLPPLPSGTSHFNIADRTLDYILWCSPLKTLRTRGETLPILPIPHPRGGAPVDSEFLLSALLPLLLRSFLRTATTG